MPGYFQQSLLELGLSRLPCNTAKLVELHFGVARTISRKQFDVFNRQIQLVITGIAKFQAVMRRAHGLDGAKPGKARDPVLCVDHDITFGKCRSFRDKV